MALTHAPSACPLPHPVLLFLVTFPLSPQGKRSHQKNRLHSVISEYRASTSSLNTEIVVSQLPEWDLRAEAKTIDVHFPPASDPFLALPLENCAAEMTSHSSLPLESLVFHQPASISHDYCLIWKEKSLTHSTVLVVAKNKDLLCHIN